VVVFEPFYENYGPDAILSGATPRFVKLQPPNWSFDPAELAAAFGPATKAIILNTPNNPTGKVFTRAEIEQIRDLCHRWDAFLITDEIYEHMVYDGAEHIPAATIEGLRDRTITINALSKTYSVTGWRVGWAIAPPEVSTAIRKVHDFMTVGAAAPLQEAGITALHFPDSYYEQLAVDYLRRRDKAVGILEGVGIRCFVPRGAYYIMTDISAFGFPDDVAFARFLVKEIGVACVPGSSFYRNPADGSKQVRFAFCKTDKTLDAAAERLSKLRAKI
jgi:aspartate/methionine/tyrosine aminotransferase